MMTRNTFYKLITLAIFTTTLSACGGGGDEATTTSNEPNTPIVAPAVVLVWDGSTNWNNSNWK